MYREKKNWQIINNKRWAFSSIKKIRRGLHGMKAAGGVVMVMGILAADSSVVESIKRRFVRVEK